jgi:hypothetical protein
VKFLFVLLLGLFLVLFGVLGFGFFCVLDVEVGLLDDLEDLRFGFGDGLLLEVVDALLLPL